MVVVVVAAVVVVVVVLLLINVVVGVLLFSFSSPSSSLQRLRPVYKACPPHFASIVTASTLNPNTDEIGKIRDCQRRFLLLAFTGQPTKAKQAVSQLLAWQLILQVDQACECLLPLRCCHCGFRLSQLGTNLVFSIKELGLVGPPPFTQQSRQDANQISAPTGSIG